MVSEDAYGIFMEKAVLSPADGEGVRIWQFCPLSHFVTALPKGEPSRYAQQIK